MNSNVFYTIEQAAELCHLSTDYIYRITKSGEIGHYKIGRRVLISDEQLNQWLNSKRQYTKYEREIVAETHVALN